MMIFMALVYFSLSFSYHIFLCTIKPEIGMGRNESLRAYVYRVRVYRFFVQFNRKLLSEMMYASST